MFNQAVPVPQGQFHAADIAYNRKQSVTDYQASGSAKVLQQD